MLKLTKVFKSLADRQVLNGADFALKNEVVALVGENGAGKTTLLRIIFGEIKPDDGSVQISGLIGYVPQEPTFGLKIKDCFHQELEQWQIDIAMQEVGLDKPICCMVEQLSEAKRLD